MCGAAVPAPPAGHGSVDPVRRVRRLVPLRLPARGPQEAPEGPQRRLPLRLPLTPTPQRPSVSLYIPKLPWLTCQACISCSPKSRNLPAVVTKDGNDALSFFTKLRCSSGGEREGGGGGGAHLIIEGWISFGFHCLERPDQK